MKKLLQTAGRFLLAASAALMLVQQVHAEIEEVPPDIQLISHGRVAMFGESAPGVRRYINRMSMNDRPAYCVEPDVAVLFNRDQGPMYQKTDWSAVDEETRMKIKRLAYYGYGYPETGDSNEAYIATQLLVWKTLDAENYDTYYDLLEICGYVSFGSLACRNGKGNLPELMEQIAARAETHQTVPSFVQPDAYELSWSEPLILNDADDVLQRFELDSSSSYPGIRVTQNGSQLSIEVDSSLLQQEILAPEVELQFVRHPQDWDELKAGLVVYTSGECQKVYLDSGIEPTHGFTLKVRLNTSSIELDKLDEYGTPVADACFIAGFDPQFESVISASPGVPRTYCSDAAGKVRLDHLPDQTEIYLKEVSVSEGYEVSEEVFQLRTGGNGSVAYGTVIDALRSLDLQLIKEDEEDSSIKLSGAEFEVYELSDTGFDEQIIRPGLQSGESVPAVTEGTSIWFFRKDQEYALNQLFPDAASFLLKEDNPHIKLTERDGQTYLLASQHAHAILQLKDLSGAVTGQFSIYSTTSLPDGKLQGLPVFRGLTGGNYLRLSDPFRHSRPIADTSIRLYQEESMNTLAAELSSDAFGSVNLESLEPGTYWYLHPVTLKPVSIQVSDRSQRTGILNIPQLKYGKSYLVCETALVDGYDYGRSEACAIHTMKLPGRQSLMKVEANNARRKLKINVVKVDRDDERIPLDHAWFTVEDLSVTEGLDPSRVRIEDIPADAVSGDLFYVRNALSQGAVQRWKIAAIEPDAIRIVSAQDNAEYLIPRHGFDPSVPMLYQDLIRAVNPLREGAVFELTEKEDSSMVHAYRILSLQKENGTDVFGSPMKEQVIHSAILQEGDLAPFTVYSSGAVSGSLGMYVTGGLLVQKTEERSAMPVSFEQLCDQAGGMDQLQAGYEFSAPLKQTVRMPSYKDVIGSAAQPGELFHYDGNEWRLDVIESDRVIISDRGQQFCLGKETICGALSYTDSAMLKVTRLDRSGETLTGILLENGKGDSWYLRPNETLQANESGLAGVYAEVSKDSSFSNVIKDGYTDASGRLLFPDLPEGEYWIRTGEEVRRGTVRQGTLEITDIPYGHSIRVCEVKSPLGYLIGNACEVIVPTSAYTKDTVENHRTNAKIRTTIRQVQKIRKMGAE